MIMVAAALMVARRLMLVIDLLFGMPVTMIGHCYLGTP